MERGTTAGLALALSVGILAPVGAQRPARPAASPLAGLDQYVAQAMRVWKVPGLAISVVKGDSMILAKGYGVRKLGDPTPVDAHTMFAIGSASKAFTGATVGMLVDEGKAGWDQPVTAYLPWFEMYDPWVTREIRVRDLLTHRSGLNRGDMVWYGTNRTREESLRAVRLIKPATSMRTRFGYQNLMFVAAGEVVHTLTGKSWDDVVAERIFGPLGMTESNTSVRALEGRPDVATPHAELDDTIRVVPYRNIDNAGPAGSINSTVVDMAKWIRLWLDRGAFNGRRVLSEATIKEAMTPQMIINDPFWLHLVGDETNFLTYGFGWAVNDFRGKKLVWHGGNIDGMSAMVGFMPGEKIGVTVLTNLNQSEITFPLLEWISDRLMGFTPKDYSAELFAKVETLQRSGRERAATRAAARVPDTKPSLPLEQYTGKYVNDLYGTATVALDSDHLTVRYDANPNGVADLRHWHFDVFEAVMRDRMLRRIPLSFELGADGKVARMNFDLEGPISWRRDSASGATTNR